MPALTYLWIIPLLPLLGAAVNGIFGGRWPKASSRPSRFPRRRSPFSPRSKSCANSSRSPADQIPWTQSYFTWISAGGFRADFALQVDQLTVIMLLVVTGVGWLIHIYSTGYMHDDPGYRRFFSYLNLFMFFMLTLVLAANYLLMFVGWEGVGLCSYLLIGFWFLKQVRHRRRQQGVLGKPRRRLRFPARRVPDLPHVRHARLRDRVFRAPPRMPAGARRAAARSRRSRCCCSSARPENPRSFRSTSGCRTRWRAPRRSAR